MLSVPRKTHRNRNYICGAAWARGRLLRSRNANARKCSSHINWGRCATQHVAWAKENLPELSDETQALNAHLASKIQGELILAPLTRGTHVPFRRLCHSFGCSVTFSEMAYARQLVKGNKRERTRMRKFEDEQLFAFQIATNAIDEGIRAAHMAHDAQAAFIDLNTGCPIYEATRRGLGSVLLRKPRKLATLVRGIVQESPIPVTVKLRLGESSSSINVDAIVPLLERAGAAMVTIHGRTAVQRYKRPADWSYIEAAANAASIPVVGNGDLLTLFDIQQRRQNTACAALMIGRAALIKPWVFEESKQGVEIMPTANERVGIYRQLVSYMKEYFHDDSLGKKRANYFLPWHLGFFCRYRPLPASVYQDVSSAAMPLMQARHAIADPLIGEDLDSLPMLEQLLRCENTSAHQKMADVLWDARSDRDAIQQLMALGNDLDVWRADTVSNASSNEDDRAEG